MVGLLFILAFGLLITIAGATWWTMRRLRRPPRRTYGAAVARGLPGDPSELSEPREWQAWTASCRIAGRSVDLPAWDIAGDDPQAPVIVLTPGWGDSKVGALVRAQALAPVASRLIAWDPPGQGEAPGLCSLGTREHEAIAAIVNQLSDEAHQRGVILYGWSLGAGVSVVAASAMASDDRIVGVIAEAPYRLPQTPARNVILNASMPWRINGPIAFWLLGMRLGVGPKWSGFDRVEHARGLSCPLLVAQGSQDEVCPVDDGRAIASAAARGLFVEIEGGHHSDLWTDERFKTPIQSVVTDFIRSLGLPTRDAPTTIET